MLVILFNALKEESCVVGVFVVAQLVYAVSVDVNLIIGVVDTLVDLLTAVETGGTIVVEIAVIVLFRVESNDFGVEVELFQVGAIYDVYHL